jgi:Skp family chaperone for outer membrane proteins
MQGDAKVRHLDLTADQGGYPVSKQLLTLAILTAALSGGVAWGQNNAAPRTNNAASAARPASSSAGTVIDTAYVITKHPRRVAYYEEINKKIKANQAEAQAFAKEKQKQHEKLRDLKVGSTEYRDLMQELIQKEADFAAAAKVRDSQLTEEIAKFDLEIYQEVKEAIRTFATRKGIDLVLNYSSESPSLENPQSFPKAVVNPVQYQSDLNITEDILKMLSQTEQARNPNPAGGRPTTNRR